VAEKQALKEWNKYSSMRAWRSGEAKLDFINRLRKQTATPMARDLLPLLEMVKDATEPFLMFM
jgi:hypothetical protein